MGAKLPTPAESGSAKASSIVKLFAGGEGEGGAERERVQKRASSGVKQRCLLKDGSCAARQVTKGTGFGGPTREVAGSRDFAWRARSSSWSRSPLPRWPE